MSPDLVETRTVVTLLLADLHCALADLAGRSRSPARAYALQSLALRTYAEVLGLLPRLSISEDEHRAIRLQAAVLKARMMELGTEGPMPEAVSDSSPRLVAVAQSEAR
jgi:hypothetical protein